jgi:tetratricopeptide (TPR) repeat protein
MYLPSAGLITLLVTLGYLLMARVAHHRTCEDRRSPSGRRWLALQWCAAIVSIAIVTLGSWGTIRRNRDYQSELSIWQSSIRAEPDVYRAHSTYGALPESAGKVDKAVEHYRQALALNPNYFDTNRPYIDRRHDERPLN